MPPRFGGWVEFQEEVCRGGERTRCLLINHRDRVAVTLTTDETRLYRRIAHGDYLVGNPATGEAAFLTEMAEQGYLEGAPRPAGTRQIGFTRAWKFARTLDLRISCANRLVERVHSGVAHRLFTPGAVAGQVILALMGVAAVLHAFIFPAALQLRVHPVQIPLVIGLSLFAIVVHEFAHALVVVHNGRRIDAVGFRLHLGTPAFYVESIDALLLSRRQRILQAFAGSWAEWMVTSAVAMWVWIAPTHLALILLYRFVVLNTITICSNLLPFVGLDGHLLFADLIGEPDLGEATRGAFGRLLASVISRRPLTGRDIALAIYSAVNAAVALALLLMAGLFWYALFGGAIASLAHHGATGWCVLLALAVVLVRPAAVAAGPRIVTSLHTCAEMLSRLRFRQQWRWRIAATAAFAAVVPDLAALDEADLGIVAGDLERWQSRRPDLALNRAAGWVYVHRGLVRLSDGRLSAPKSVHQSRAIAHCARGTVLILKHADGLVPVS